MKGDLFMDNRYFINEELLLDEESINLYHYLNKSPYHRRQQAYNEEEQGDKHEKLYKLAKKF